MKRIRGNTGSPGRLRWVEVNLDRIERNVAEWVRFLEGTPLLVLVKADGYGHGMVAVARRALAGGAMMLGVTSVEEGEVLRREGIIAPILLLQPLLPGQAAAAVGENLRVTIVDRLGADELAHAARRIGRKATVHVKVDTGMGRFGRSADEATDLIRYVINTPELLLEGVFSHLAAAEEGDGVRTAAQIQRLQDLKRRCREEWPDVPIRFHLSNSAGALFFPDARFDMCRIGLGCYGVYPVREGEDADRPPREGKGPRLAPALSLHAQVVALRDVGAGFSVGYGGTYKTAKPTRLGVIAAGYANGVPRALSNRGRVLLRGRSFPIVGWVCMNQTFVDLGPDAPVRVGDEAVLLGRQGDEEISVEEWCRLLDTIPHEILCSLGRWRPRVYRVSRSRSR